MSFHDFARGQLSKLDILTATSSKVPMMNSSFEERNSNVSFEKTKVNISRQLPSVKLLRGERAGATRRGQNAVSRGLGRGCALSSQSKTAQLTEKRCVQKFMFSDQ